MPSTKLSYDFINFLLTTSLILNKFLFETLSNKNRLLLNASSSSNIFLITQFPGVAIKETYLMHKED